MNVQVLAEAVQSAGLRYGAERNRPLKVPVLPRLETRWPTGSVILGIFGYGSVVEIVG